MSKTSQHTIKNIFKITFMVIAVNVCALTTQYFLDSQQKSGLADVSVAEYTQTLIQGKILPMVFTVAHHFLD